MQYNTDPLSVCPDLSLFPNQNKKIDVATTTVRRLEERGGGADSLPCLYSNNSPEIDLITGQAIADNPVLALVSVLTPYHKKQAQSLYLNVERLVNKEAKSPNHVGFLTLTFPDNVKDYKEASRRFDSFSKNFLLKHSDFGHWICTKEQQKRGSWHYHLLICLSQDIKSGVNFEELSQRRYTSASAYLRNLWKELREAMPKYNFGRSELQPIKSNAEAMGRYIGKYISKHIGSRDNSSKGARLVTYSQGWVKNSMKMSWNTDNAKLWRTKVKMFAWNNGCTELYQLKEKLGSTWAYKHQDDILNIFDIITELPRPPKKEYVSPAIKKTVRQKSAREAKMVKNLTLHGRSIQKIIEKENQAVRSSVAIRSSVEDWLQSDNYILQAAKWDKEKALRPLIDYKTGEILPTTTNEVPF